MAGPGRPGPGKASPGRPGLARAGHFFARERSQKTNNIPLIKSHSAMNGQATCAEKKRHKKGTALRIIDRLTSNNKAKVSMHGYFLSQRKVNKTSIKYSAEQRFVHVL